MQRLQFDLGEQISRKEYLRRKRKSSNSLKKRSKITYIIGGCFSVLLIYTIVQLIIYRSKNNFKYTAGDGLENQDIYNIFFVTEGYTYDPVYSVSSILSSGEYETSVLPSSGLAEISVTPDYIYGIKEDKLCRANRNSKEVEELVGEGVKKYVVNGDKIFFTTLENERLKLYNINTGEVKDLDSTSVKEIVTNESYIFVVMNNGVEKALYRYNNLGEDRTQLTSDINVSYLIEDNGTIYFTNKKDSNHIYKIKEDGSGLSKLGDIKGVADDGVIKEVDGKKYFFIQDNTLYYVNSGDENTLWGYNLDTNENTKIISASIELLQNIDDTIFYKIDKEMGVYLYNYNTRFMSLVTKRRVKEFVVDYYEI